MRRRPWLVVSAVLLSTLLFSQTPAARRKATQAAAEEAANKRNSGNWRAIHNSALVIDTHADTPQRFVDEGFDLAQEAGKGHMDFSKIKAGNLGAEFWSIWVEPEQFKGHEAKRSLDLTDAVY